MVLVRYEQSISWQFVIGIMYGYTMIHETTFHSDLLKIEIFQKWSAFRSKPPVWVVMNCPLQHHMATMFFRNQGAKVSRKMGRYTLEAFENSVVFFDKELRDMSSRTRGGGNVKVVVLQRFFHGMVLLMTIESG